jgi:FkbM family methyltransferase
MEVYYENNINEDELLSKLYHLHSRLKIKYGGFHEELPEQKMSISFLAGNEKVLEIGGNIGRNSLIISSILENDMNLVTLESDTSICKQLVENREINNLNFNIENSALSIRTIIQKRWNTIPSDVLLEGYNWVNTITFDELQTKYNIIFDTLVLDCEGAFYYILQDFPQLLNNINLIIMENDYLDINQKKYVDEILVKNNFCSIYREAGGWGDNCPCSNVFFEVWKR